MSSGTTLAGDSGTAMVFAYITPSDSRIKARFPRLTAAEYRANVSKLSSTEEGVMSQAAPAPATGGELGERRLGTIHAVAQALAIGPMFSTAVVLGFVSAPVTGAGGLGVCRGAGRCVPPGPACGGPVSGGPPHRIRFFAVPPPVPGRRGRV